MDEFDRLIEEMERKIGEKERAIYSAETIEHAHNPKNLRRMDRADAFAVVHGWCGDTMEIYLRLDKKRRIREATFMTDGCGSTVACGSVLTIMVQGKSLEEAWMSTPQEVIAALNGLPEESVHCAGLAVNTLKAAIANQSAKDKS